MHKILIIIDWFTPAYKGGGPITSVYNFVKNLNDSFEFFILTSDKDLDNTQLNVPKNSWTDFDRNIKVYYATGPKQVARILKKFPRDLTLINGIFSPLFSILPLILSEKGKIIVFPRDMLSQHSLSIKPLKKKAYLAFAKRLLFPKAIFWATSGTELTRLKNDFPGIKTDLVTNFVSPELLNKPVDKKPGHLRLVTITRISPKKNLLFAAKVLSNIRDTQITWDIYGPKEDEDYYQTLAHSLEKLPPNIKATLKKPLTPDRIRPVIAEYHFFYFPTLGENFGHVIFEAFAASRPVIISNTTPWRNLQNKGLGWDLPLDVKSFATAIKKAADLNNEKFRQLSRQTYNFAFNYIRDQEKHVLIIKRKLQKLINSRQ